MHVRRALALVGAVTAAAFTACKELPFGPRWDADMYMPLSTQPIALAGFVPAPPLNIIPPGGSKAVSFPPQRQSVTGAIGDVLKNLVTDPTRARTMLALTLAKTTAVAVQDTLFVAKDSASLFVAAPDRIALSVPLLTTDLSKTDSTSLTTAQIGMLQNAPCKILQFPPCGSVWVQLRGTVSNPGASNVTITATDSVKISLSVTARIAVVHK
jgi:hypothetical protein